jgi:hypothetical protein
LKINLVLREKIKSFSTVRLCLHLRDLTFFLQNKTKKKEEINIILLNKFLEKKVFS